MDGPLRAADGHVLLTMVAEVKPPSPPKVSSGWLGSLESTGRIVGDIVSPATAVDDWEALGR